MVSQLSFSGQAVKAHDPDRFLLSFFAPQAAREGLWALFAFNHEIAKTRDVVRDTRLGLIRLQWWREAVARMYDTGDTAVHPVFQPLWDCVRLHGLEREVFDQLLYAREFDLEDVLPADLQGLQHYADFTTTPLMRLAMRVCDPAQNDPPECVQAVAQNYALAGILRAVPFLAAQGRCLLPEKMLRDHGIDAEVLYAGKSPEAVARVVKDVAEAIMPHQKPQNRFLRATSALSQIYFQQIKALKYNVYHPKMCLPPPLKVLRLLLS